MADGFNDSVIGFVLGPLFGVIAAFVGWIIWIKTRKDVRARDAATLATATEERAARKLDSERSLAKEVEEKNRSLAKEVEENMNEHIDHLIATLKQDLELSRQRINSRIDTLDARLDQDKKDLAEHLQDIRDEFRNFHKQNPGTR